MTNEELSQRIAELYGIKTHTYMNGELLFWLHDDSARCFELMVEHEISVEFYEESAETWNRSRADKLSIAVEGYENDKALATRVAILKCLLKMKE